MAILPIPGTKGFVVDSGTGNVWRVGNQGGVHHPVTGQRDVTGKISDLPPAIQNSARAQLNDYEASNPMNFLREFSESFSGGSEAYEPSAEEKLLLQLQIEQIQRGVEVSNAALAREGARRDAFSRFLSGGEWNPTNQDEYEGMLAGMSANIAREEMGFLSKALKGEQPVRPGTERGIREQEGILQERLLRRQGPTEATDTARTEAEARFAQTAEELRNADRFALLERGIQPAASAASLAHSAIGEYIPGEIPGLGSTYSSLAQRRLQGQQLENQKMLGLAGLVPSLMGSQGGSRQELADFLSYVGQSGKSSGGGYGALAGGLIGGLATAAIPGVGAFLAPLGAELGRRAGQGAGTYFRTGETSGLYSGFTNAGGNAGPTLNYGGYSGFGSGAGSSYPSGWTTSWG